MYPIYGSDTKKWQTNNFNVKNVALYLLYQNTIMELEGLVVLART